MTQDHCKAQDFGVFLDLWNETQNQTTPHIHRRIATWLQKCWARGDRRFLLQAFRASGKSTLAGIFLAWVLHLDPDLRILVLSAESRLANKMARTIRKTIEKHPSTKHLIPRNPDNWSSSSFTVNRPRISRDPSVMACGLSANITGARADIILCDDVEVPNTCDTAEKRIALRERLSENEFILVPGGRQIYIGTPHSYYTIYARKPRKEIGEEKNFLYKYRRLEIPILEQGLSTWPERYSPDDIEDIRIQSGPLKFAAQMMLQPTNIVNGRLDPSLLRRYEAEIVYDEVQKKAVLFLGANKICSASAWWDPSFGSAKGDASVVALVYTDTHGNQYLHRVDYITVKPGEGEDAATLQCRRVAEMARDFYIPGLTIETNGIGKFLPAILKNIFGEMGVPCGVIESHSAQAKDIRILEAFDAVMAARRLYVHDSVYRTPFITELQEWRPGLAGQRDDGLDAAAGALLSEPVRLHRTYAPRARSWRGGTSHTARTEFDV